MRFYCYTCSFQVAAVVCENCRHPTALSNLAGKVDGVVYCYGGCGLKYADFPLDLILPTPLWNRIAVGPPFDETQTKVEREGRGGVLCAACIVKRLAKLTHMTVVFLTTDAEQAIVEAEQRGYDRAIAEREPER